MEEPERVGIVVPCFNEAARFDRDAYVAALESMPALSLILVNDGSSDLTLDVLESLRQRFPDRVHVIDQQPNQGKAAAVRAGMRHAMSAANDFAGYWDADLSTPLEAVPDFLGLFRDQPDTELVLGARVALLGHSIQRRMSRHYLGRVFATGVSQVLALPVYDTQCGAKLMRCTPALAALFDEPFASPWIFDVELLARYLKGRREPHRIMELPLWQWHDAGGSKVRPVDFLRSFGELFDVHRRYHLNAGHGRLMNFATAPFNRYALAGVPGTLAHFGSLIAGVELLAISPVAATLLGAGVGAAINYFMNYHFTFVSKAPHARTFSRFVPVALIGAALSGVGVWLGSAHAGLHYVAAQLLASAIFLGIGFALNRGWSFRARGSSGTD